MRVYLLVKENIYEICQAVGLSKDANGDECCESALQSREQHIKKERALSNICISALLTNYSTLYAMFKGFLNH